MWKYSYVQIQGAHPPHPAPQRQNDTFIFRSLYNLICKYYIVLSTLYAVHCTLETANVHCTQYTLICTFYTISFIVCWSLYTDHCRQYTAYIVAHPVDPAANYSITMGRASPQTYYNVSCLFVMNWLSHPSFSIFIYICIFKV